MLNEKIVDSEQELVGKKIVAINLCDQYSLGYIIVEGGELICFEENDEGISIPSNSSVERKLLYNKNLKDLFLKHNCITQEEYNKYESILNEKRKKAEESERDKEYKQYLKLKAKFELNS